MADLVIRGMEMPKNCLVCKLAQHRVFACSVACPITGQIVGYYDEGFHQEEHVCPLISLSEGHGRLIDGDALLSVLNILRDKGCDGPVWDQMRDIVENMVTIVPAERGTGDAD